MKVSLAGAVVFCFGLLLSVAAQKVKVDLPHGHNHATSDSAITQDSAVVVSILSDDSYYIAGTQIPKEHLAVELGESIKTLNTKNKIVYIAASTDLIYGSFVKVLDLLRAQGVGNFGLIVNRTETDDPGVLLVEVPMMRDPGEDVSMLKPNPLTLVTQVALDLQLRLNRDAGPRRGEACFSSAPNGFGSDPANLERFLKCFFKRRAKLRAYKPGMETRADIPLDQRIEKIVFVKAPQSIKYGVVVRVINALRGAGANPIGLQIDDLP
jgi:biopolymer transport protein ExbD